MAVKVLVAAPKAIVDVAAPEFTGPKVILEGSCSVVDDTTVVWVSITVVVGVTAVFDVRASEVIGETVLLDGMILDELLDDSGLACAAF